MGVTYMVEPGPSPNPEIDGLAADYGWAHLHALHRLLAAEEQIDLYTMERYGGERPWSAVTTDLRPLFDSAYFVDGRLPSTECGLMRRRLREISDHWSRGEFAGEADDTMKLDQWRTIENLIAVVDACVATGRPMIIG